MRRFIRFLFWLLGSVVVVVGAVALLAYVVSNHKLERHYTAEVAAVPPSAGPDAIANGKHLATIRGCRACHGNDMGGGAVIDNAAMGRIWGPNLTGGAGGVGGRLTDADWVRAIRHGIAADGHALLVMPSNDFAGLSDADVADILAYAKSVPAVDRETPPLALGPVARGLLTAGKFPVAADLIDHRADLGAHPSVAVEVTPTYGRYLATTCYGCHNPRFTGGKIAAGPPDWPPAANLTRGPGSAVVGWTEADFIRTLRTMKAPDGRKVDRVMPSVFGQMTDTELKALWAYLQTLPPAATGA